MYRWDQRAGYAGTVTFPTVYGTNGFTNFCIAGDCVLSNGVWTHAANAGGEANRLRVTVGGNLLVADATITADLLGYNNKTGPGSVNGQGAAHGGAGYLNLMTYGSVVAPTNLGSAGGSNTGPAMTVPWRATKGAPWFSWINTRMPVSRSI